MTQADARAGSDLTASIALLIGGAMWGLYWIPVRFFEHQGLTGSWPGIAMYLPAVICLLPLVWRHRHSLSANWRSLILSGVFTGAAFSLYTASLVYTDVVRAILLFYLTPIWGTLLGILFLGERLQPKRALGLVCGIGGLFVVLGGEQGLPWPKNAGDCLALLSGIAWALGSLGLFRTRGIAIPIQVFGFLAGALFVGFAGVFLEMYLGLPNPALGIFGEAIPYAVGSALFVLPMLFLTIWPATKLTPARVGLLLMSEVVVGLFSAALFSGDPFGWRELAGATLIVSAAILEITPGKSGDR